VASLSFSTVWWIWLSQQYGVGVHGIAGEWSWHPVHATHT